MNQGLIRTPLYIRSFSDFPVVQYGDDTLIVMQADASQLIYVKVLLQTFAASTHLKVNFHMSVIVPLKH